VGIYDFAIIDSLSRIYVSHFCVGIGQFSPRWGNLSTYWIDSLWDNDVGEL